MARPAFTPHADASAVNDDVRALFDDIAAGLRHEQRAYSGECHPAIDVLETDQAIEVVVDVSGVPQEGLRVLFRSGVLIIAGEKAPGPAPAEHTFHLVEREFGRFARAVQIATAIDVPRASASLVNGELTVILPKRDERRGHGHPIAISIPARGPA